MSSQRLNITVESEPFDSHIHEALIDLGYVPRNDIFYSLSFPLSESAFAHYNAAIQAVDFAITTHGVTSKVYMQLQNTEAVWGV